MANPSDVAQVNIPVECFACTQSIDDKSQTSVQCSCCCRWAHSKCAVHKDVFGLLGKMDKDKKMVIVGDLMFFCDPCVKEIKDFINIKNSSTSTTENVNTESSTSEPVVLSKSKATSTDSVPSPVSTEKGDPAKQNLNSLREKRTCSFYTRGTCRHGSSGKVGMNGRTCDFSHPKKCPRFCKYGFDEEKGCNRSCSLFHPFLCNSSLRYGYCYKNRCTYQHLHGTVRIANQNNFSGRQFAPNPLQPASVPRQYNNYQYKPNDFPPLHMSNLFQSEQVQPQNMTNPFQSEQLKPQNFSSVPNGKNVSDPFAQLFDAIKDLKSQNTYIRDELNSMKYSIRGSFPSNEQYYPDPHQNILHEKNPKNFPSQGDGFRK